MRYKLVILPILFFVLNQLLAQTEHIVRIDTSRVVFKPGLSFPYWLNAGQKLKKEVAIKTISVLEFNLDSSGNLKFVKPFSLTSNDEVTVPDGKVWKIEALGLRETLEYGKEGVTSQTTKDFSTSAKPSIFTSPATFVTPGSYKWTVPPDVNRICVEIWGAGGKGGDIILSGHPNPGNMIYVFSGSGGGGGYGYQCFDIKPNTQLEVKVGASTEDTFLGDLLIAPSGFDGKAGYLSDTALSFGEGGIGSKTSAYFNIDGQSGTTDKGGNGANNGGIGGVNGGTSNGYFQNYSYYDSKSGSIINGGEISYMPSNYAPQSPGGGGAGIGYRSSYNYFSSMGSPIKIERNNFGCAGKIIIYW